MVTMTFHSLPGLHNREDDVDFVGDFPMALDQKLLIEKVVDEDVTERTPSSRHPSVSERATWIRGPLSDCP